MKRKTIVNLLLVTIGLFILYWLSYTDSRQKSVSSGRKLLLSHVSWNEVASLDLHKEGETITLASGDSGAWFVPIRGNYPASVSSIRSFLLKLMDLSSSQTIETTPEGMKKMGLSAHDDEHSRGAIVLKAKDGKEIETLFLGTLRTRKNASDEDLLSLSGQFVRLGSGNEVFLVPLPVTFATDMGAWIEASILKIEQDQVYQVAAVSRGDATGTPLYTIRRTSPLLGEAEPEFAFSETAPAGKEVSQTVVRQVTMALEDLKAEDVYPREDETVRDFTPEKSVYFSLVNGLVYGVHVQDIDGAYFITIETTRDEALITSLETAFEEQKSHAEAQKKDKEAEEAAEKADEDSEAAKENSGEPASEDAVEKEEDAGLKIASEEFARSERDRFESWVYVVPDFVGRKFLKDIETFFKEIPSEEDQGL
jgi:hypothetical protein